MPSTENRVLNAQAAKVLRPLIDLAEVQFGEKPRRVADRLGDLCQLETGYGKLVNCTVNRSGKIVVVVSSRGVSDLQTAEYTLPELLHDCSTVS